MNENKNISTEISKTKSYPLLPYSQLVWDMLQTEPDVYWYRFVLRIRESDVDAKKLHNAFTTAIGNHPVFSMVMDSAGKQHFEELKDILHGQFHSVDITKEDEYILVKGHYNRILGDATSSLMITEELFKAYEGLPLKKDNYLDYLEQQCRLQQSERYEENKQWLEECFGNTDCPMHPYSDLPLTSNKKSYEGLITEDYSDFKSAIQTIEKQHLITPTAFFSLCAALAIMDYNNTDVAALTWAYDGRDTEEEQYIYGSLHRDVPMVISRISNNKKQKTRLSQEELLKQVRQQIRDGIKHSSYPYTLLPPQNKKWNYAVNVLQQPTNTAILKRAPFNIEIIEQDEEETCPAYSLLDIEIYDEEQLTLLYRYSVTHYKKESMLRFADMVRKNAEWLLDTTK